MACSNCFNGCTEIISDQCVRYTGLSIPALGITSGDTLASVELNITNYILGLGDGSLVIPQINPGDLCTLVESFLPSSGDINLNHVISAIIQSICSLQTQVDSVTSDMTTLNANYSIECLTGVTASSDTHDILQAAITRLCLVDVNLTALALDLVTNYVPLASLNTLIQNYLDSIAPLSLQQNRMVPYVAYEYYGSLVGFDITGAGSGNWINVYLCNGNNGTPDKRGRVAVGVTDGSMQGGAMSSVVDPATPLAGNPSYSIGGTAGQNSVILLTTQLPSHSHSATAISTASPHNHQPASGGDFAIWLNNQANAGSGSTGFEVSPNNHPSSTSNVTVDITTSVVVNVTGGGLSHNNVQPSMGAYYIMYIP